MNNAVTDTYIGSHLRKAKKIRIFFLLLKCLIRIMATTIMR